MREYKSNPKLKLLARYQMQGITSILVVALILELLISLALDLICSTLIPGDGLVAEVASIVISVLIKIVLGLLTAGYCLLTLHASCNMPTSLQDLFYCFQNSPEKAMLLKIPFVVIQTICLLPANIFLYMHPTVAFYVDPRQSYQFLWIFFLGAIVNMLLTLPLMPVFYLMFDFPSLSVGEIYKKSFEIMRGNNLRYLSIQLSFIPWMLTAFLSIGLSLLWVVPYMRMTTCNFYLDLMSYRNKGLSDDNYDMYS